MHNIYKVDPVPPQGNHYYIFKAPILEKELMMGIMLSSKL